MPTDQTAQQINTFVAQPINNLVVFLAIVALVILLVAAFLVWKFAPALINLYKQQADTNRQNAETAAKLTQIVEQNATQSQLAIQSVDKNTSEMAKQTAAIEAQTGVIEGQGRDFRSYQTLVSDNMSAHTNEIAENSAKIDELKKSIDNLSEQIRTLLEDKAACAEAEDRIRKLRDEIVDIVNKQQARATVLVDTAPAPETGDAKREAA